MNGFTPEDLQRVIDIKNTTTDLKSNVRDINKELRLQGELTVNVNTEFSNINSSTSKFVALQKEAQQSSSATAKAIREQTKQQNVVKTLNIQIDDLYRRSRKTNDATAKFVKDIPGLRKLSGPFDEAAKASRQTVLSNAKALDIQGRVGKLNVDALKNGKGLTAQKLKQMNLTDITQGKTGPAAAKLLRDAKATSKTQIVGVAGLKAGFKSLGPVITKALGPLALLKIAADIAKFFWDAMIGASKATADMSRNMLISREAAGELYTKTLPGIVGQYNQIAKTQNETTITTEAYSKALGDINNELGMQLNLAEDFGNQTSLNVAEVAKMQENFGLSAKASTQLFLEATATNKPLKDINTSIFGTLGLMSVQSGLQIDINKTIEEAVGITGNMRANFGYSTESIAKAVFQAKLLGLSLSQADGISSSLLNFQSSIESEMEAELMLGRSLNLEEARRAALMGDTETLMTEISQQAGSQEDFLKMNIFQRQALAKAVGLEVNALADMYKDREENDALAEKSLELQNKLEGKNIQLKTDKNGKILNSLAEITAASKATGESEEKIREILGGQVRLRKQEEDATQKFAKAMQQAKEAFSRLVDGGALDKLVDIFSGMAESSMFSGFKEEGEAKRIRDEAVNTKLSQDKIDIAELALEAQSQATGVDDVRDVAGAALSGAAIGAALTAWLGPGALVGAAIGGLVGGGVAALVNMGDQMEADIRLDTAKELDLTPDSVDDFILRPGQAPIKFNKDDLLIGGTNLNGGGDGNVEMILNKILTAVEGGGDVYMDGAKVGKSLALATSRMG